MNIEFACQPSNSAAIVTLSPHESMITEGGAMISMSAGLQIETTTLQRGGQGGFLSGLKRLVGGESFFLNHYTAGPAGGELLLGTTLSGDMMSYELDNERLVVRGGAFVAGGPQVSIDASWQGFKGVLGNGSLFWLTASGTGPVVLASFGAIYPVEVNGEYIIDNGHIVAFNETLDFELVKAGGSWMSSLLGGEGLVCRFSGKGTVWCQSHNPSAFGGALGPHLKQRS
jgi:uncharacterized protein (TIGR00266 family)